MRGACAIDIDKDRTFISFADLSKGRFNFIEETELELSFCDNDFLKFLKDNSETLNAKIREREKSYSLTVEKIYLNLPWSTDNVNTVEEIIPLKRRKKLDFDDLVFAKKYLEDIFLDWDDFCLHHFIYEYEVEGKTYQRFPLGVFGKKIKLKSVLFTVKDKLHQDIESIIDNLDRILGSILSKTASSLYTSVKELNIESVTVVLSIDYAYTYGIILDSGRIRGKEKFDFGIEKIIHEIEKKFSFSFSLAEEVFHRYVTFKETACAKEVSIKNDSTYLNLSTQTLNSFVAGYIKGELCRILSEIEKKNSIRNFIVYFAGRLNNKEGFCDLLKENSPYFTGIPFCKESASLSLGCLRYGLFRPWESDFGKTNKSLFQRIKEIYRDYF